MAGSFCACLVITLFRLPSNLLPIQMERTETIAQIFTLGYQQSQTCQQSLEPAVANSLEQALHVVEVVY